VPGGAIPLEGGWDERTVSLAQAVYERMLELHRQGLNGLWARLLKNNFAPLTVGQFDYIVGNPPWVNWEHLPDGYRRATMPLWERYGLFPHGGMDTILGKGKKDISMLMTFTVMDGLLNEGGGSSALSLRSPCLRHQARARAFGGCRFPKAAASRSLLQSCTWTILVDLNPFEGASNRTAVMILEKGEADEVPRPLHGLAQKEGGSLQLRKLPGRGYGGHPAPAVLCRTR
jgi:hypothetical protein